MSKLQLWLVRHGETEWSLSGAHTGRTDIPLTERGKEGALALGCALQGHRFALVLSSPLQRASETCRLAGFAENAEIDGNLREWDYGDCEGKSTAEIRQQRPGWNLWENGVTGGETLEQVAARAGQILDRVLPLEGDIALFAHGHILRILAACWIGLPPRTASLFALDTATISVLGWERDTRVLRVWNRSTQAI